MSLELQATDDLVRLTELDHHDAFAQLARTEAAVRAAVLDRDDDAVESVPRRSS
jgi:hypothetical protein